MSRLAKTAKQVLIGAVFLSKKGYFMYKDKSTVYPFLKNKLIARPLVLNVSILILYSFYIFLKLRARESLIPLHYNIYFGVDLIDNKYQIFKLPLIALVVLTINCYLGKLVYKQEKLVSYILVWASLAVMIILVFAGVFILNI